MTSDLSSSSDDLPVGALTPAAGAPATVDVAQPMPGLKRKVIAGLVFLCMIAAGFAFFGDVTKLRAAAGGFAPKAIALGFALAGCNYLLRIARWQYYLHCIDVTLPLLDSALVFLSGFVMSITPGKVGEVFKSWLLLDTYRIPFARSAPIVVAERLTDLIALVLLTALGSLAFEHGTLVAAAGAVLVSGMVLVCAYRPLGEAILGLAERIKPLAPTVRKLREAYESLLTMLKPGPLLIGTALGVVAWGLECAALYAIVHGYPGVQLAWDAAVFSYAASTILGALAMLPGGLGVTEYGMTNLLQQLAGGHMASEVATAATLLARLATLWFAVVLGVVAFVVFRIRHRQPRV